MLAKQQQNALALIGIAIAIFLVLGMLLSAPPLTINTTENDAEIAFRSSKGAVLFSGDCLNVSWEVENIAAVYLNNQGTVGQGAEVVCVYGETQHYALQPKTAQILTIRSPFRFYLLIHWSTSAQCWQSFYCCQAFICYLGNGFVNFMIRQLSDG